LDDVHAAGLLGAGSIAQYDALFAGSESAIAEFRTRLPERLRPGDRVQDYRDGRPEVRAAIRNAERFLVLAALVSVLLGGVAVAIAARRFVARRLDTVAVMKCLGARYRDVLRLNLLQLLLLVAAAAVVGCIGGLLAQFGLTALLADFVEARLPPPLQLGRVPPARVLRSDLDPPPLRYLTIYGVAAVAVVSLLYVLFGDIELIAYLTAGALAMFALLYFAGRLLVSLLQRVRGRV